MDSHKSGSGILSKMAALALTLVLSVVATAATTRRLPLAEYREKMEAGWLGQMIGVEWGLPTEFRYQGKTIPDDKVPAWKPEMINHAYGNDDLYVEMTFLHSLDRHGIEVTSRQAGLDFANTAYGLCAANFAGRDNLRRGIAPPDCGHPKFNPCADCIDYQIESDYAGLISPGMPQRVIDLAEVFGGLVNQGDGVWAGAFMGGLYAEAFFTDDVNVLLDAGLACIPVESQYAGMVRDVRRWHAESPDDWRACWQKVQARYVDDPKFHRGRIDQPGSDVKPNGAFVVMGLLYGKGDLERTIRVSMQCGWDSDCNPSSAAGVLLTAKGLRAIDGKYLSGLDRKRKFLHTEYDFDAMLAVCERLMRQNLAKVGGRTERDGTGREILVIPVITPVPMPCRPNWNPPAPTGNRYTPEEMAKVTKKPFPGIGAVLRGRERQPLPPIGEGEKWMLGKHTEEYGMSLIPFCFAPYDLEREPLPIRIRGLTNTVIHLGWAKCHVSSYRTLFSFEDCENVILREATVFVHAKPETNPPPLYATVNSSQVKVYDVHRASVGSDPVDLTTWLPDLPERGASGGRFPTLDEARKKSVLVPGDLARFEAKWKKLQAGEQVVVAVIGGSITAGARASKLELRWGDRVAAGIQRAFPQAKVVHVNAGIGATGSDIAAFRLKDDLLSKNPDIVLIEFSVNDQGDLARAETMEGVVRQLYADPNGIAVLMLGMVHKGGGNVQNWHSKVARHYGVPYVSYRDAIFPGVASGAYEWSDLSPDDIHPNDVGHAWAAALVNSFLAEQCADFLSSGRKPSVPGPMPSALFTTDYDRCRFLHLGDLKPVENTGFVPYDENHWGRSLCCSNAHSRLVIEFEGATAKLLYRLGKYPHGRAKVTVDGEVIAPALEGYRDQWWSYTPVLDLLRAKPGRHRLEVETLGEKDSASEGFGFRLCGLLVADLASWEHPLSFDPKIEKKECFDPVDEMLHLERLPLEKRGVSVRYEGSIDRQGLNNDGSWMLYRASSNEWTVFEHLGPGCIMNFTKHGWLDERGDVTFRFYFDGEAEPRFVIRPIEFGQKTPLLSPLADMYIAPATRKPWGNDFDGIRIVRSFVPMPFAKSCRITSSVKLSGNGWGHVLCHCYYDGRQVETFNPFEPSYLVAKRKFSQCGRNPIAMKRPVIASGSFALAPGARHVVFSSDGSGLVAGIRFVTHDFVREDATNLWVRAYWNGVAEPDVEVPFGSLFANELSYNAISTLLAGSGADGSYYNYQPMPFAHGAKIEVENRGGREVRFDLATITSTQEYDAFYAQNPYGVFRGRYYPPTKTFVGRDTVFAQLPGRGHVTGSVLTGRQTPVRIEVADKSDIRYKSWQIWEGDARILLDGVRTPQVESDGSESYSSYGWGFWDPPQSNPFSAYDCIRAHDWCMTRLLLTDAYPFDGGCRFGFEAGGENQYPMIHSGTVFWYAYSGGEWREIDVTRTPPGKTVELKSVFEGDLAFGKPLARKGVYGEPAELTFTVPTGTIAVVVRRVSDQAKPRQMAAVAVNGCEVVGRPWYVPDFNPYHRWLEDDYRVPASMLKPGECNRVCIRPEPCGGETAFNDFGYRVFAVVK